MLSLTEMLCRAWSCVARCAGAEKQSEGRATPKEDNVADDLTVIRGIGVASQNRLNRAGIKTYADLARTTPKELEKIIGRSPPGTSFDECISRAGELAGTA